VLRRPIETAPLLGMWEFQFNLTPHSVFSEGGFLHLVATAATKWPNKELAFPVLRNRFAANRFFRCNIYSFSFSLSKFAFLFACRFTGSSPVTSTRPLLFFFRQLMLQVAIKLIAISCRGLVSREAAVTLLGGLFYCFFLEAEEVDIVLADELHNFPIRLQLED
jgi:hypothetical protein